MVSTETSRLRAVLFDRDGTLVVDVPYNGNPDLVRPMPGAADYERVGEVIECHEPGGGPPYLVRWEPDGHTALFYPAGTAAVVHSGPSHR